MSDKRPPLLPTGKAWQRTKPGPLADGAVSPGAPARPQPPLKEVLKGLDARELDGQTLFDQYFGGELPPTPPDAAKKPKR